MKQYEILDLVGHVHWQDVEAEINRMAQDGFEVVCTIRPNVLLLAKEELPPSALQEAGKRIFPIEIHNVRTEEEIEELAKLNCYSLQGVWKGMRPGENITVSLDNRHNASVGAAKTLLQMVVNERHKGFRGVAIGAPNVIRCVRMMDGYVVWEFDFDSNAFMRCPNPEIAERDGAELTEED